MARARLALAAGLVGLACTSCVRVSWSRVQVGRPIAEELHAEFSSSQTDIDQCLEVLGAPLYVWEISDVEYGLAYGWDRHRGWGVNVSVPISRAVSASIDYEDLDLQLFGVVLIFDRHDRLLRKRTGYLKEILADPARRRPAFVEPAAPAESAGIEE